MLLIFSNVLQCSMFTYNCFIYTMCFIIPAFLFTLAVLKDVGSLVRTQSHIQRKDQVFPHVYWLMLTDRLWFRQTRWHQNQTELGILFQARGFQIVLHTLFGTALSRPLSQRTSWRSSSPQTVMRSVTRRRLISGVKGWKDPKNRMEIGVWTIKEQIPENCFVFVFKPFSIFTLQAYTLMDVAGIWSSTRICFGS